ncbi:MAG: hypothetical protein LBL31_05245 [Spirochaetaceae bacterium]|nr:hypothetical protein [Spirochaetaceae bacterium]
MRIAQNSKLKPHSGLSPSRVHAIAALAEGSPRMAEGSPRMAEGSPRMAEGSPRMAEGSPCMAEGSPCVCEGRPRASSRYEVFPTGGIRQNKF